MKDKEVYGFEMALVAETYLSTLSAKMSPKGIDRYYVPLLFIHEHSGKVTQKDVGDALKRDKVTVMRMVNHLSDLGLVERKKCSQDARSQILHCTAKGAALIPDIEEAIAETNDLLFAGFDKNERDAFKKGMYKLMQQIDELPEAEFIVNAVKRQKK